LHHPNSLSSYLLPIMPFLAFWGFGERNPLGFRAMASIVVALGVAMVVMVSQSRVGLALILVNVPAVLLMVNRWRPTRVTRFLSLIVVVGMVLAGLKGADTIWKRFANAQSAAGRTELNQTAALMMADHPLLGVGLNQYPRLASDTPEYRAHLVRMANEEQLGVAHHMYWLTVAEMGILGLLVYLIIVFRFWWLACRHAWQRGSPGSLLLAGYMIGVGSVHLQALYEWVLRQTSVAYMFLVMSAVCVWLAGRARTGATPEVAL
jgi:putative inorganic carbon (HCO3(-)) transporter